jgi:D-alanyl-D-alanine carboxypeptidase
MGDRGRRARARSGVAVLIATFLLLLARPAAAQIGSDRYSAMVLDAATGTVLYAANADQPRYPASLTKLMTIYMLFEALRDRRVFLDELVPVSVYAASVEPSKLGLLPGARVTVEQALLGLVTKSANDAAAALGEMLAGDEDRFAQMMTLRARGLGMTHTTFRNASGLPDPDQVTTAEDMAILARHLIQDFPREYGYFSVPGFVFRGRMIPNHDRMLDSFPGADGLKTGYTVAAGHNLVTSALRGGVRLVGVVLGAGSSWERDQDMTAMLTAGFDRMGVAPMVAALPPPRFTLFAAARAAAPRMAAQPRTVWGRGTARGMARAQQDVVAPYEAWFRAPAGTRRLAAARQMIQPAMATAGPPRLTRAAGTAHLARHRTHG